jgi:hypothetical protein
MGRIQEDGTEFVWASRDARMITYIIEDWKLTFEIYDVGQSYKARLARAEKLGSRVPVSKGDVPRAIYLKGRDKALAYHSAYRHEQEARSSLKESPHIQLSLGL